MRRGAAPRPGRETAGSLAACAALAALTVAVPGPSRAPGATIQEADTTVQDTTVQDTAVQDTAVRDTAVRDTTGGLPGDTIPAGRPGVGPDSAGVDVAGRREALGGGEFPQRDGFFQRLAELPGYQIIEYRGERVSLRVPERVIDLSRQAQVNYGPDVLRADSVRYLGELRFLRATGSIELVGSQTDPVTSDSTLLYDVTGRRGTIFDARTRFANQGTNWYVRGDAIPVGQDTLFADPGQFTSCELETPHYAFRAGRLKTVTSDFIVAWPVVLYVGNVPVMWLPFFAQDIRPGRRSGILPPRFGFNDVVKTSEGYDRHVEGFGYYWAINEFMDTELTMDWFSGNYLRANAAFRYEFLKKFMSGSASASRSWGDRGNSLRVSWDHRQELSPDTRLTASVAFVENTDLFQNRSFDSRDQTQTIDSDIAFSHRLDFASLSVNARRRQFLSGDGQVQMTLPSVNVNFSPVTLFQAPRNRAGPFNNITWNGSANFTRTTADRESGAQEERRAGSASTSFRVGDFSLSGRSSYRQQMETPVDSAGTPLSQESQTTIDWSSSLDYQLDLMGSTTFRPTADLSGTLFRSDSTGGRFVSAPSRMSFGANLSTDLYGFFPGFGPFAQFRHRISPQVSWRYSPEVTTDPELAEIPGFPAATGVAQNRLTVSLSQSIEAKMAGGQDAEGSGASGDTAAAPSGEAPRTSRDTAQAVGEGAGSVAGDTAADAGRTAGTGAGDERARKVTLLSLSTSGLEFDFERAKRDLPVLVTEQMTANVNSDLLRGLSLNMTYDLFEGAGNERTLKPILTRLSTSFSFRSGTGLGQIFGLGGGGGEEPQATTSRRRRNQFGGRPFSREERPRIPEGARGSGPWDLSLRYSLSRSRAGEGGGRESQNLSGTLRLEPTPNWSIWWDTSYNFTTSEFGRHMLELERDLHRWRATFRFVKNPNGNFLFDVMVQLTDAPDLKVEYDQRTQAAQ